MTEDLSATVAYRSIKRLSIPLRQIAKLELSPNNLLRLNENEMKTILSLLSSGKAIANDLNVDELLEKENINQTAKILMDIWNLDPALQLDCHNCHGESDVYVQYDFQLEVT